MSPGYDTRYLFRQLKKRKNKALISNPDDVYIIKNYSESNTAELGGYIGLKMTGELYDCFSHDAVVELLEPWRVSCENGFGISSPKSLTLWKSEKLLNTLRSKDLESWIENELPLGDNEDVVGKIKGYVW